MSETGHRTGRSKPLFWLMRFMNKARQNLLVEELAYVK
jgi:hypothetical protein